MHALLPLALALACASATVPAEPTATATEPAPAATPPPTGQEIDVAALAAALASDSVPVLVDVRTPGEYADGHVAGAINIPLGDLGSRLGELATYQSGPVYLICQSGGRSGRAMDQLLAAGFAEPINVQGGTGGWIAAGYPVE